ncbi:ABC transporter substrate-binding protein [Clostridium fallax]|uniref:NitT/TauT family transport system substrate-binding protein n=1 Tax=Clostridium fallax TaxID=1533 RepID=A0A1M4Y6F8_9CLOT|nr:ABC transporter substrate-binding protein [Clostridium fallax]SHF01351.1 NitT/TauT family transport system substrate-binding protein [Clostridium fallax]SQB07454.1 ABC transporter substrate-binding protein [Clostridium fallax]
MKKFLKFNTLLLSFIFFTLLFIGCTKNTEKLTKINLAEVTHSVFYAPQYVAISQGFFEEEGLEVELMAAQGADKTMAALISGEVQIGLMGPEASIYVYNQKNKDYAVNFAQLTKRDGSFLIAREKDDDFEFEDLEGKVVLGGRKGGVPEMTLEYVIKNSGLNIGTNVEEDEVNVRTDIQFNVMAGAFTGGEGDYVTLFEPSATLLEKEGKGYIVASIGEKSGEIPYTAYSSTKSYIEKNPEVIQRFTNAVYKGQLYVENHSAEEIAKAIAPFFTDMKMEDLITVINRYKEIDAWCENPILKEESLNRLMEVMDLAGELDSKPPYSEIVDIKYANEAIKNIK